MSHHLISNPEFQQVTHDFTSARLLNRDPLRDYPEEYKTSADIFMNLSGISSFSIIFEKLNNLDVPIPWNHEKYEIWVSNASYDLIPDDYYSYEYQILKNPDDGWTKIREVHMGTDLNCNNSFTEQNMGVYSSPILFKYARFTIRKTPALDETKIRITVGMR